MIQFKLKTLGASLFNSKAVIDATEKAEERVLKRFGAFVRQRAKTSIRKRKRKVSPPGMPPYSHTGRLRKLIKFAYDRSRSSVVIGPELASGQHKIPTIPEVAEYGGIEQGDGSVVYIANATGRFTSGGKTRVVLDGPIAYAPRPYMRPALDAELPKLPQLWRDSIK